jgi:hypothetical protein
MIKVHWMQQNVIYVPNVDNWLTGVHIGRQWSALVVSFGKELYIDSFATAPGTDWVWPTRVINQEAQCIKSVCGHGMRSKCLSQRDCAAILQFFWKFSGASSMLWQCSRRKFPPGEFFKTLWYIQGYDIKMIVIPSGSERVQWPRWSSPLSSPAVCVLALSIQSIVDISSVDYKSLFHFEILQKGSGVLSAIINPNGQSRVASPNKAS